MSPAPCSPRGAGLTEFDLDRTGAVKTRCAMSATGRVNEHRRRGRELLRYRKTDVFTYMLSTS
jgi:hypothetical protein